MDSIPHSSQDRNLPRPLQTLIAALNAHGCQPRETGTGWMALCPAHDDHNPSLSIGVTESGSLTVRCFAGCATTRVVQELGLRMDDVFPPAARRDAFRRRRENGEPHTAHPSRAYPTAEDAIRAVEQSAWGGTPTTTKYIYEDSQRQPTIMILRCDLPGGRKDIRPISRAPDGWVRRMPQPPWPIYRLPDVESANLHELVIVTEGEKAAEAAIRCGMLATTSAGGAKAAEKTSWTPLRDRDVVVLPDHDLAGYEYAETVAALCIEAGAHSVRIVRLADHISGFPEGGDIADVLAHETWYGQRVNGTDDPRELGKIIREWASKTDPWTPPEAEGVPEWRQFPVDALPEPLARFVRQASSSVGADPVLVVFPLLACLGRCLGLRVAIEMKDDHTWIEYPIIWSAVGTHSGGGKTPALQLVTAPLDDIEHQYYLEYERALKRYKKAVKEYETTKKKAHGNDSTPPECPEEPKPKQLLTKDVTREAVVEVLDQTKDALLIVADELAGLLASFDAYKKTSGSDVGFWLQVWSGESYSVNRKTGDKKHIYIRHAAVSICGGIQTRILLRHLRGVFHAREPGLTVDNGLAARFLISVPPRRWLTWDEMRGSHVSTEDIGVVMRKLLELPGQDDGQGGTKPTILRLSQEAQRISREVYDENIRASQNEHEDQRIAALSKLRAYAFRIMLILECVQAVIDGREPKEIGVDSAKRARKIVEWVSYEVMRVYAMVEAGEEGDRLRTLLDWIPIYTRRVERDYITARDVQRGLRRYQGAGGAGRAAVDLEELVKQQKLTKESENGQTRYRLASQYRDIDKKSNNDDGHTDKYPPSGNGAEAKEKPAEEKTCRGNLQRTVSSVDAPPFFSSTSTPQKHEKRVSVMTDDSGDTQCRRNSVLDLVEWVAARGGAITVRDLCRSHRSYRGRKTDAERDLNNLVEKGYGYWDDSRSGENVRGRAPRLFRLYPKDGSGPSNDQGHNPPGNFVDEIRRQEGFRRQGSVDENKFVDTPLGGEHRETATEFRRQEDFRRQESVDENDFRRQESVDENDFRRQESVDEINFVDTPPVPVSLVSSGTSFGGHYFLVSTPADLDATISDLSRYPILGVDTETTGLDPHSDHLRLIQLSTPDHHTYVIDCAAVDPRPLAPVLERVTITGHHLQFDLQFLAAAGFPWASVDSCWDTMLAAIVLDGVGPAKGRHTLQALAERFLGVNLPKEQQRSNWSGELSSEQLEYAARDAAVLLPLRDVLEAALRRDAILDTAELEFRCLPAMAWMEHAGLLVDREAWTELAKQQKAEAERLKSELDATTSEPVNWNSPKQVLAWLRDLDVQVPSTDVAALLEHAEGHPPIRTLLEWRKASKLASTYGLAFLEHIHSATGRIHPDWHQIGARTGRMSCSNPNLQNLPRREEYRQCIVPSPGCAFIVADYSQIELRVVAALSGDRRLLEAYRDGVDVHCQTASMVLGVAEAEITKADRQLAKVLNFSLLYGCGVQKLQETLFVNHGIVVSLERARELHRGFFDVYKGLRAWQRRVIESQEPEVRLESGRLIREVERGPQQANYRVQGLAGDGLKHAIALLWETRDTCPSARLVAAVHDELLVEVAEDEAERAREWVERCMLEGMRRVVSGVEIEVEAKVCKSWAGK